MTSGMLCGTIGFTILPVGVVLAVPGPDQPAEDSAITPPCMWTTEEPAKSTWPWPMPQLTPICESQPSPQTQLPNTGYMIVPMQHAVDHEGGELPSLRGAAGRDRRRRVHEDHLEEEERERGGVIAGALQQESLPPMSPRKCPPSVMPNSWFSPA